MHESWFNHVSIDYDIHHAEEHEPEGGIWLG